jgi:hypothetical protein
MLFKTVDSYKNNRFGTTWINHILSTYCKNKWCAVLDIDEIIRVDNLNELIIDMNKQSANICNFYLLDMYPKHDQLEYKKGTPFLSHSNYYDKESDINKDYHSGVRKRTMNVCAFLKKKSFFKYTFSCCANINIGYHELNIYEYKHYTCIRFYNKTLILLHFKFIKPNLKDFFITRVQNNQDWNDNIEYRKYANSPNYIFYNPEYSLCINEHSPSFSFI